MVRRTAWVGTWPGRGLIVVLAVTLAALLVPAIFQWHVHANAFAPLSAHWHPRFGPGTIPAVLIAVAAWRWSPTLAIRLPWPRLMMLVLVAGLGWLLALATVDGRAGLATILQDPNEYLLTARRVTDVSALLHHFVAGIPNDTSTPWPTHVAGHPPGALLFFVLLVRLGLGGGLAAGLTVTVLAATTPVAALMTLRRLGAEAPARRSAAILTFGPAAAWSAVSADAVFAAVAAWGLFALAAATRARTARARASWSMLAGLLLGSCLYLSYGLALVAILAVGVLVAARDWRPLPLAAFGAVLVALAFTAGGFRWWQALPVLRERYYTGIAHIRPASYWLWGDLGALALGAGLVLGPSVGAALARARAGLSTPSRPVVVLTLASACCIVIADLSSMSKAEVERIWLPFVPWLLVGAGLLPTRWRRWALAGQLVLALTLQTVLFTRW